MPLSDRLASKEQAFALLAAYQPYTQKWRYACKQLDLAERDNG